MERDKIKIKIKNKKTEMWPRNLFIAVAYQMQ